MKFPNDIVADTPAYRALLAHASKLEQTIKDSGDELPRLREEINKLQASRKEWEEHVLVRPSLPSLRFILIILSFSPQLSWRKKI